MSLLGPVMSHPSVTMCSFSRKDRRSTGSQMVTDLRSLVGRQMEKSHSMHSDQYCCRSIFPLHQGHLIVVLVWLMFYFTCRFDPVMRWPSGTRFHRARGPRMPGILSHVWVEVISREMVNRHSSHFSTCTTSWWVMDAPHCGHFIIHPPSLLGPPICIAQ